MTSHAVTRAALALRTDAPRMGARRAGRALSVLLAGVLGLLLLASPAQGQSENGEAGKVMAASQYLSDNDSFDNQGAAAASSVPALRALRLSKAGSDVPALRRRISVQLREATVEQALKRIAREVGLELVYLREVVQVDKKVTLNAQEVSVREALREALRGTGLEIMLMPSGQLIVMEQRAAAMPPEVPFNHRMAEAQVGTITGTVTADGTGNPLPGVNVVIEGTQQGAATDAEGTYTITGVEVGTYTLVASFIGYGDEVEEGVEVADGETTTVDFALQPGDLGLDELVVVGYGTQQRQDITGAVSSVSVEDITEIPADNLADQLQGRVPGVSIQTSGRPGNPARVRIRGTGTIGNNDPLYVIDGIPTRGGLNQINLNSIESIQVLKDAASASIYGARASNGVVVITTKKGRPATEPQINVDYYSGMQSPTNLPEMLNTRQWAETLWEAQINAGLDPSHPQLGSGDEPIIPDYISPAGHFEGEVDEADYDATENQIVRANKEGTDWYSVLFDPAAMHQLNLSASGGAEGASYFISGGYFTQNGIVEYTGFDRYSAQSNTQVSIGDNVTVGENLSVTYTSQQGSGGFVGGAATMLPIVPVYDIRGNFAGSAPAGVGNTRNPYGDVYTRRHDRNQRLRAFGNAYIEVDAIKNVLLTSRIGIDYGTYRSTGFEVRDYWNTEAPPHNNYNEFASRSVNWTWSNTIDYDTILNDVHNIEVLGGAELVSYGDRNISASRSDFFSTDINYRYIGAGNQGISNAGGGSGWGLFSLFGRADYTYDDKYLLSATVRRDGSSRFGEENRYGIFPAFSGGWRVSSEPFAENVDFVSNLLLRASWGQTGNQEIGNYPFATTYGASLNENSYAISGAQNSVVTGFDQQVFGNPGVQWETTTQTNIGMDAGLFDNRLSFVIDLYRKKTTDMLLQVPQPATAGDAAFPYVNIGSMMNEGIEVGINYTDVVGDLYYDVGINASHNSNEVLGLSGDQEFISSDPARTQVGHPVSAYYGYIIDGIFQTEEEVENHADQTQKAVGRWKYRDLNNDGVIDPEDRTFIGNPHPDLSYGLSSQFGYKGFDLSIFVQGTLGNDIYHAAKSYQDFWFFLNNRSTRILDTWTPQNRDAELPEVNATNPNNEATKPSTYFVEDGSYLRLKNLQLGYSFSGGLVPGTDGVRVYLQAKNLLTITGYSGIDPEVGGGDLRLGVDSNHYPLARTFTFGVNVTL